MSNVNVNKNESIKIIKNFIQDLSFENPQNINENNSVNNNNNEIDVNMNVVYKPYNNNFFSLNLSISACITSNLELTPKSSTLSLDTKPWFL